MQVHESLLRPGGECLGALAGAVGKSIIGWLYPSWDISAEALSAADAFLTGAAPPALRRLISEGRSGVERAFAARAYDTT